MHSGQVLGGQAETSKRNQKRPLVSKSNKIEGMLIKLCIQDGFWVARPKRRKESKSIHWFQKQVKLKNAAEITHSGGVLDGWAEISKSNQKHPLASKSNKVEGMVIKSCILDGFWAARPNRRKVNQSIHWLQKQVKLKECW